MKYLVRQPPTLEVLSIERLGEWIAAQATLLQSPLSEIHERDPSTAELMLSRNIEVIRDYVERYLPWKLHDKLADALSSSLMKTEESLTSSNNYYRTVIGRFIETLFTKGLTCLSLHDEGTGIFFPSLRAKSYMLSSLIELKFSDNIDIVNIKEMDIMKLLKDLHNLSYLTLTCYMKSDNILMSIAENCQLIEVLNLYSMIHFDENCFNSLTQLRHLRKLGLHIPGDNKDGIATLLMSCENLEYVETPPPGLFKALIYMTTLNKNSGKRLKLKSYVDGSGSLITSQRLQLVVEMFPHIQEISLTNYETDENILMPLRQLQDLRKLTLTRFNFRADHVDELLRIIGRNLLYLRFEHIYQIDLNALMCINQTCPNLESLSMTFCRFEIESSECDFIHTLSITNPTFKNLKKLSTEASYSIEGQSRHEELLFLLSICPNIEYISINEIPLRDELWLRVLDRNPLKCLKELKTYIDVDNPPSALVLERVVINRPQVIICDSDSDTDSDS